MLENDEKSYAPKKVYLPPYRPEEELKSKFSLSHQLLFLSIALGLGFAYLVWRVGSSNWSAFYVSFPLLLAEFLEWGIVLILGFHIVLFFDKKKKPKQIAVEDIDKKVDIFIPTYNESIDILIPTITFAKNVNGVNKVWVLDDGDRGEIKGLSEELGVEYIRRDDNLNAKAGNINNALKFTDSDYLIIIDADHFIAPDYIQKVLPFFYDSSDMALVQVPHDFYNVDSFDHFPKKYKKKMYSWHEQIAFFHYIQPSRSNVNCAFWCGSGAMVDTKILKSIGGIATESICEDFETTILLHSKGYKTRYLDERMIYGLAPRNWEEYIGQRKRWCLGGIQAIVKKWKEYKTLNSIQKVCHFLVGFQWLFCFRTLAYLYTPIVCILFDVNPMNVNILQFLIFWFIVNGLYSLVLYSIAPVYFRPVISFLVELRKISPVFAGLKDFLFKKQEIKFEVTDKGVSKKKIEKTRVSYLFYAFYFGYPIIGLLAVIVYFFRGNIFFTEISIQSLTLISFWTLVSIFLVDKTIRQIMDKRFSRLSQRRYYRFPASFKINVDNIEVPVEYYNVLGLSVKDFDAEIGQKVVLKEFGKKIIMDVTYKNDKSTVLEFLPNDFKSKSLVCNNLISFERERKL